MDSVMMIGRLLVSLAAVLGVMWVIARRMRRGTRGRSARFVEVLDRTSLSRSSSVAVVRVGEQALVLGVADAQVSVLGETDLAAALAAREAAAGPRRTARARAGHRQAVRAEVPAPVAPVAAGVHPTRLTSVPASSPVADATSAPAARGPLTGSALSPQTWRQTIESLRDLTARP